MTWPTPSARLFERAERVRYAVATGGNASWGSKPVAAARPPARINGAVTHQPTPTAESVTREEGEHTSGRRQVLKTDPRKP